MEYTEFETFVVQSSAYLKAKIEQADARFAIRDFPRYEYDLFRGEIWWSNVGNPKVRARVTVVGSTSTISNTWLWAWANDHFADVRLGDIYKVREFGEAEGIAKLVEPKWDADEVDGWEMTAVAARLLESQGAYRPPGKDGSLFLLYDGLELIPDSERHAYMPLKRR